MTVVMGIDSAGAGCSERAGLLSASRNITTVDHLAPRNSFGVGHTKELAAVRLTHQGAKDLARSSRPEFIDKFFLRGSKHSPLVKSQTPYHYADARQVRG